MLANAQKDFPEHGNVGLHASIN